MEDQVEVQNNIESIKLPSSLQPGEKGYFTVFNTNISVPCEITRVGFLTHKVLYDIALIVESEGSETYKIHMDNIDSVFVQREQIDQKNN